MLGPIGVGAVGANVEDRLRPLGEAAANVEAMIRAGEAEGVPFVLTGSAGLRLATFDTARHTLRPTQTELLRRR